MKFNEQFLQDPDAEGSQYGVVPAGEYDVTISGAEIKATKNGLGNYVALTLDITSKDFVGRKIFDTINYKNPSEVAQDIGRRRLIDVRNAVGLKSLTDTNQLIGGKMTVKVVIKKDDQYGDKNEVKSYKALDSSKMPIGGSGFGRPTKPAVVVESGSKMPGAKATVAEPVAEVMVNNSVADAPPKAPWK